MNPLRPVAFHLAALAVGGLCAAFAWSKEKTPLASYESGAVVFGGRASDVQRIVYETASRKLTLEAKEDGGQRWFYGSVQPLPLPSPVKVFPSMAPALKLAEALVPLRATRSLGKLESSRAVELGLERRDSNLTIVVGGKEHKLIIGGPSPGNTDKYVLDTATEQVYAIKFDPFQDMEAGDNRLAERDQHDFRELDTASAKIIFADKTRTVYFGGPEGKKFWADPSDREKADETVGNWMQKVDRLRATDFVAKQPDNAVLVARIEYTGSTKRKGFFELLKTPSSTEGDKHDYWMTTEYLHMYGKVMPTFGEQVEQDIGSVVR